MGPGVAVEALGMELLRRPKQEAQEIDAQSLRLAYRLKGDFAALRAVQFAHVAKRE